MSFKKVIFPFIKFKTKELQDLLDKLYKTTIYRVNKMLLVRMLKLEI